MSDALKAAQRESFEIQEAVAEHLHRLGAQGSWWALLGGETVDDGTSLRVTLVLETWYGDRGTPQSPRSEGAMSDG